MQRIRKKYDEKDPRRLCRAMGIALIFKPMGKGPEACKGFYLLQSRKQAIVVNSDLSEELQSVIIMHEIGHAVLHRQSSGLKSFHDFAIFDSTSVYEYEANLFAADYYLEDDEVLGLLNQDLSFFQMASLQKVPAELLDFKFRALKRKGYQVFEPPILANADFLKNVE